MTLVAELTQALKEMTDVCKEARAQRDEALDLWRRYQASDKAIARLVAEVLAIALSGPERPRLLKALADYDLAYKEAKGSA